MYNASVDLYDAKGQVIKHDITSPMDDWTGENSTWQPYGTNMTFPAGPVFPFDIVINFVAQQLEPSNYTDIGDLGHQIPPMDELHELDPGPSPSRPPDDDYDVSFVALPYFWNSQDTLDMRNHTYPACDIDPKLYPLTDNPDMSTRVLACWWPCPIMPASSEKGS